MNAILRTDKLGVSVLSFNRPEALNALSPGLFVDLRNHLEDINRSTDTIGCVIVKGEGKSFSAGNDLKALERGETAPSPDFQGETIAAIEKLAQPVIASVRGHCLTGALELALACDLLIASDNAIFADTHGRWGLAPSWGMSQRLPRRVGPMVASELMFTGREVSGREAVLLGLANRSVPDVDLEETTWELAQQCVSNSWWSLRQVKRLLLASSDVGLSAGLALERDTNHRSPDAMSRIARFTGASVKPKEETFHDVGAE